MPDPALLRLGTTHRCTRRRTLAALSSPKAVSTMPEAPVLCPGSNRAWMPDTSAAEIPGPLRCLSAAAEAQGPLAAVIIFYRALVESGFTAPVDALADALHDLGAFSRSAFSSAASRIRKLRGFHRAHVGGDTAPSVIVNTTGFALAMSQGGNPFRNCDCPVLQAVLAGSARGAVAPGKPGFVAARSCHECCPSRARRPDHDESSLLQSRIRSGMLRPSAGS